MNEDFGGDYIFFSDCFLTESRTAVEAALIRDISQLRKGARVLDLGCGTGRVAIELAKAGVSVLGVDHSEQALGEAVRRTGNNSSVEYMKLDWHHDGAWPTGFDLCLSWYTSFGLAGDDEAERAILRRVASSLNFGGCLVIDHINRDQKLADFQAVQIHGRGSDFMMDVDRLDSVHRQIHRRRIFVRAAARREISYTIRLFGCSEISDWLRHAGFGAIEFRDESGGPLKKTSRRMIILAWKLQPR